MALGVAPQGTRLIAAAQALGAPKGVARPQPKAKANLPRPQKTKANLPRPQSHPVKAAPHAQAAKPSTVAFNPLAGTLNTQQLQTLARNTAQSQQKAELAPLQNQAREIQGNEAGVQQRFQQYGQAQDAQLGAIGQSAEASAKTAQNNAAELALKSGQAVEGTGQSQSALTGGYIAPELKAEINAEGARAASTGATGTSLAAQGAQNENNFMANLRATAAAKVTEGAKGISSLYGKQLGENENKQGEAAAKLAPNEAKLLTELGQKQFTDQITAQGLGIKTQTLAQKGQETAAKLKTTERGQNVTRQSAREKAILTARGLNIKEGQQGFNEWATREKLAVSKLSAADKARYDEAQVRIKSAAASGKAANPKEGRSYESKLSTAESIAKSVLGNVNQGRGNAQLQQKAREELRAKGASSDVIAAALNLAVYHRLSTADQAAAISYGLTPNIRPEWFKKQ